MRLFLLLLLIFSLGCVSEEKTAKPEPIALKPEMECEVCGMRVLDYPGPKAQVHFSNREPAVFDDTSDFLLWYLQPDRPRTITAMYVQDMGATDWDHPRDAWIPAETAYYVLNHTRIGTMGNSPAPFSNKGEAEIFIKKYGGEIYRFDEITIELLQSSLNFSLSQSSCGPLQLFKFLNDTPPSAPL